MNDIESLTAEQAVSRGVLNNPTKIPSVEKFTQDELERMTDFGVLVWCSMTMVDSIWAAKVVHEMMKREETDAKRMVRRQVELIKLEGANHFVSTSILSGSPVMT